jgi:hypothetical protein
MTSSLFKSSHGAFAPAAPATWSFEDVPHQRAEDEADDDDASSIAASSPATADMDDTLEQDDVDPDGFSLLGKTFSRQSTPESDATTEEDEARAFKVQRDTARQAVLFIGGLGGWLDNDQSGDYDPTQKAVDSTPAQRRKRPAEDVLRPPRIASSSQGEAKRHKGSVTTARQTGVKFDHIFEHKTFEIALLCQSIPDTWPSENSWNAFTDKEAAAIANNSGVYNLRQRRELNNSHSSTRSTNSDQHEDGLSDLTGHPLARGCKGCRELGDRCSLLEPGATYPCEACLEISHDCQLNVEPAHKQACEHCKQKRKHCSYDENEDDHEKPCIGCAKAGFKCFAGAAQEPGRTRLTEDGLPSTLPLPLTSRKNKGKARAEVSTLAPATPAKCTSRYLKCTACQESGRRCSLQRKKPQLPCKHCKEDDITCELEDTANKPTPSMSRPAASNLSKISANTASVSRLIANIPPTSTSASFIVVNKPQTIKIATRLAHPIYFNQRKNPCRWCQVAMFGLYGYGSVRTPTVTIWPNGLGCSELSGGHVAAGSPAPTYMCGGCTTLRLLACACGGHDLKQIEGPTVESKGYWDKNASLKRLAYTQPATTERREQERRWCILCPTLAKWECSTAVGIPLDRMREDVSKGLPKVGCGLRLCNSCATVLQKTYKGNLNRTVKNMESNTRIKTFGKQMWLDGLRADFEFFQENSFLLKQIAGAAKIN